MNKTVDRTNKRINQDRRRFLDMMGRYGISTSVLKASGLAGAMMSARYAQAQTSSKKFVLVYHPNGAPNGAYLGGLAVAPFQGLTGVRPMEMTIQRSNPGDNHGNIHEAAGAFYDASKGPNSSITMQIAKVVGNLTPYRSIHLGVQSKMESGIDLLDGSSVSRINDPASAFQRYFNSAPPPASGGGDVMGRSMFDKRQSVLDANKQGLDMLMAELAQDEKQRLESHVVALEELQARLTMERQGAEQNQDDGASSGGGGGMACSGPTIASGTSALQEYRAQADIASAALACGLTNVVSIQFNETQASWLPNDGTADAVPYDSDHHQANHGGGAAMLPAIVGYMNKGLAHLIQNLQNAGIYNDTVVLCVSEMGDGQNHSLPNGPIVLASGMSVPGGSGGAHTSLFNGIFQSLGLESDIGGMVHNYG